jgi:hypothetical protein
MVAYPVVVFLVVGYPRDVGESILHHIPTYHPYTTVLTNSMYTRYGGS